MEKNTSAQESKWGGFLLVLILFLIVISFLTFQEGHDWGGDFSQYLIQSEAIIQNNIQGIEEFADIRVEMSENSIDPKFYPWGFPILLTPIIYLFGINIIALKIWIYLFFILSLAIIALLFRKKLDKISILFLILLFVLNPYFFNFKNHILSDIPFLAFSLISILLIQRFIIERRYLDNKPFSYFLLAIPIFIAFSIRSQGIVLVLLLILCQFIRSKKHSRFKGVLKEQKSSLITYFTLAFLIFISKSLFPQTDYLALFDVLKRSPLNLASFMLENLYYYFVSISDFFGETYFFSTFFQLTSLEIFYIIFGLTLPIFFIGLIKNYKEDYLYILYPLLTLTVLMLWPHKQGMRYILSILPFFLFFLIKGLNSLDSSNLFESNRFFKKFKISNIFVFIISILFLSQILFLTLFYYKFPVAQEGPYTNESQELFEFIKNDTGEGEIIGFFKPRVLTFYTKRPSILIRTYNHLLNSQAEYFVHYKLIEEKNPEPITLVRDNKDFQKVFENSNFEVYKLNKK